MTDRGTEFVSCAQILLKVKYPHHLVRPSWKGKYVNAMPFYRLERCLRGMEWRLPDRTWRIGGYDLEKNISESCMTISMIFSTASMSSKRTIYLCLSIVMTVLPEAGVGCGYTVLIICIHTDRPIRIPEEQKCVRSKGLPKELHWTLRDKWVLGLPLNGKGTDPSWMLGSYPTKIWWSTGGPSEASP